MRTRSHLKIFSGKLDFVALVDLLFLLLIFFLVGTSLVFQPGIPVDLPPAHGLPASPAEKIIVTIARDGSVFLNDRPVPEYQLQSRLRETVEGRTAFTAERLNLQTGDRAESRPPRIVIRADRNVNHEKIVEVMSLARSLGLGVYLITDPERRPASRTARPGGSQP